MISDTVSRLMSDSPFWIMMIHETNQPLFEKLSPPASNLWMCKAYMNAKLMELNREKLAEQGLNVDSKLITPQSKLDIFANLYDAGVEVISLDDAAPIKLEELISIPTYDGYVDMEQSLLNHSLNAALNYFYQGLLSSKTDFEDAEHLFRHMQDASFLAPIYLNEKTVGDDIDPGQLIFPTMTDCYGEACVPIFTDWRMFCDFMTANEIESGTFGAYVIHFSELMTVTESNHQQVFLLNPNSVDMRLTHHLIQRIPLMDANMYLLEKNQFMKDFCVEPVLKQEMGSVEKSSLEEEPSDPDAWKKVDPTPDFLKPKTED